MRNDLGWIFIKEWSILAKITRLFDVINRFNQNPDIWMISSFIESIVFY